MHGVVVLHPDVNESKGGSGIWDWADPDIVALEGLHERFGHAVALRAFDRGEARHQIERDGDLDGLVGGEDRAVVGEPLHRVRWDCQEFRARLGMMGAKEPAHAETQRAAYS